MNEAEIKNTATKVLRSKLSTLENEADALLYKAGKIETELFYRDNPECRPK